MLGGNVKVITTGGAPNTADVCRFFKTVISCKIFDKFGQTESGTVFS